MMLRIGDDDSVPILWEKCADLRIFGNTVIDSRTVISNHHQGRVAIDVKASEGSVEIFRIGLTIAPSGEPGRAAQTGQRLGGDS